MADTAADVQDVEIDLSDFDGEPDSPPAGPSPVGDKQPDTDTPDAPATDETPPAEGDAAKDAEPPADEAAPLDTPEAADKPYVKAEERKEQLNTEIRDLVSKRNALRDEVRTANNEAYQPATEQELVEQGLSPTDAKLEALEQREKLRDYNEQVADAQLTLESESQRVLQDFPIFDPGSEQYNQEVADAASQILQDSLITDDNTGQIIGSNVSPYKLYQTIAIASRTSEANGQAKAQKATQSMMANADAPASVAPVKKAEDPLKSFFADL